MECPAPGRIGGLEGVALLLVFLLMNAFLYNFQLPGPLNLYGSDLLVASLLALTVAAFRDERLREAHRTWLLLFAVLLAYYLVLVLYAFVWLGNGYSAVLGRFRNLYFYPLLFFTGLAFTVPGERLARYLRLVRVHVLAAVGYGLACLVVTGDNPATFYFRKQILPAPYFMLVCHGTAVLCCLLYVHELTALAAGAGRRGRAVLWMAVSLLGVLGSQHRSTVVAFAVAVLCTAAFGLRAAPQVRRGTAAGLLATALLAAAVVAGLACTPVSRLFAKRTAETVATFSGTRQFFATNAGIRVGRAVATLREWTRSPLIGCGWGSQIDEYRILDLDGKLVRTMHGTPHNYYVTVLYQTGLIGSSIMAAFFLLVLRRLWPHEGLGPHSVSAVALFSFVAGFLVLNVTSPMLDGNPVGVPLFFHLLGAAVSQRPAPSGERVPARPEGDLAGSPAGSSG